MGHHPESEPIHVVLERHDDLLERFSITSLGADDQCP
jgi:hypothetical protein